MLNIILNRGYKMNLIVKEIDNIYKELNVIIENLFLSDDEINFIINNYQLLINKEQEIVQLLNTNLESILYSKYFWISLYLKRYNEKFGYDAGIEQQQFKLINEIDERSNEGVNWKLIEDIEKKIENNDY